MPEYAYMSLAEFLASNDGQMPSFTTKSGHTSGRKSHAAQPDWEAAVEEQLTAAGLPPFVREYRFAADELGEGKGLRARLKAADLQDWRIDFAWPRQKIALEVDGGTWIKGGGGHNTGKGYEGDRDKDAALLVRGWRVLRVTPVHVQDGRAVRWVTTLLESHGRNGIDTLRKLINQYGINATLGEVAEAEEKAVSRA